MRIPVIAKMTPNITHISQPAMSAYFAGCGRCYVACSDAGHQAISFGEDRKPRMNGKKCVGCHLCRLVCPAEAIGLAARMDK